MDVITQLTTIVIALITAVVGPIAVTWAKIKITTKKPPTPVAEAININSLVDTQLDNILDELDCNRIWVAQFHNGGTFYPTGKSIQKFSVFYEKLSPNTQSLKMTLQNIPSSLFPKTLDKIYRDGELEIPSIDNATELYGLDSLAKPLNTKSLYMVGLYSVDNHLIGMMGIAYNQEEHTFTKENWVYVRQKVGVIGTLLTEYLYSIPTKKK